MFDDFCIFSTCSIQTMFVLTGPDWPKLDQKLRWIPNIPTSTSEYWIIPTVCQQGEVLNLNIFNMFLSYSNRISCILWGRCSSNIKPNQSNLSWGDNKIKIKMLQASKFNLHMHSGHSITGTNVAIIYTSIHPHHSWPCLAFSHLHNNNNFRHKSN